jgi:putative transposase
MKRWRFTEEQITGVLKAHQAGASAADLCRKHGISDATLYTWRSKYGGMEVSEAKRTPRNTRVERRLGVTIRKQGEFRGVLMQKRDWRLRQGRIVGRLGIKRARVAPRSRGARTDCRPDWRA